MKLRHTLCTVALALSAASCSSGGSNSAGGGGSGGQTSQTATTSSGGQAGASSSSRNGGSSGGLSSASSSKDVGGGQAGASSSSNKGGAGQGGSSSSSTEASCGNGASVTPCGGDVVGTWNVTPSCLKVSGERNIEGISLGCLTVSVTGTIQVSGSWSANADGTYTDKTTTTGEEKLTLVAKCLEVSGTITTCDALNGTIGVLGYESVDCVSAVGGGCTCVAKINQKGGIAFISSDPSTSGTYKTSDNGITVGQNPLTQEALQFSYCVSSGKMSWTPNVEGLTCTGAIAFQKGSTGGTGGSGGTGGTTSLGGVSSGGGAGKGGTTASGGSAGKGGTTSSSSSTGGSTSPGTGGPCDIYEAAKTPCVGAYSTVRALYKAYNGPLYQVRKTSDTTALKDIPLFEAGGYANSKVQDDFCTGGCTISKIYDQSPKKNDLPVSGKTYWLVTTPPAPASHAVATEANATAAKITVAGHTVYGVRTNSGAGNSYRVNAKGTAVGDEPEAMYEVVDAKVYSALCCYDFGNVSTTGNPDGEATMETIYYGNATLFGHGGGKGPWLMADLEAGTYPSDKQNDPNIPSLSYQNYATLMLKGHAGDRYALKAGDAQIGPLQTTWDGKRPPRYSPMKKQGAIVLGTGGDGSFLGSGVFFEGAITFGCPDDKAVDDAIQANIVAAGYGK